MRGAFRVLRDVFFKGGERDDIRDVVHSAKLTAALFEVSKAMVSTGGVIPGSMNQIVNAVLLIMNVSRSVIFLFDESGKYISPAVGAGILYMGLFRKVRISSDDKILKEIIDSKEPLLMHASRIRDDRMKGIMEKLGIDEFIVAPIVAGDRVVGIIMADTPVDGRRFSSDDIKILSVMSNFAGVAIHNANMFQRLTSKAKKLRAIYEVGRAFDDTNDLDRLLEMIIEKAVELMNATSGSIILIDRETDTLIIRAAIHLPVEIKDGVRLKVGEGITGWVAKEGMPALVPDVKKDPRYVMVQEDIHSEMAVPLKWGQEVIGVLNLDHVMRGAFKEMDLELLDIFGHNASVALRQAFLLEKIKKEDQTSS
jgi:sigma-B regulation protein RsbU (phosphoserine phosphatase)